MRSLHIESLVVVLSACVCSGMACPRPVTPSVGECREGDGTTPEAKEATTPARYSPPASWVLGPWYGTGCPAIWCGRTPLGTMTDEVNGTLDRLAQYDIPITAFHFDGFGWSPNCGPWGSGPCTCDWSLGQPLVDRMRAEKVLALMHYSGGCYAVPDFEHVYGQLGDVLGGFYWDDGANDEMVKRNIDWLQAKFPRRGEAVMKAYEGSGVQTDQGLAAYGHTSYVNDLSSDMAGLREGIRRVIVKSSLLPAPFNEFTAYDGAGKPNEETYRRRLHFGALQAVMDNSPSIIADPWDPAYSPAVVESYRYWSWLHAELNPYLHSYDFNAYETNEPLFRHTSVDAMSWGLGEELFATFVTTEGATSVPVTLPPGLWIDYWNEGLLLRRGETTFTQPAPIGREPIFIRLGAIIPMDVRREYTGHGTRESEGSLTVLVYPNGTSRFRWHDEAAQRWRTFTSTLDGDGLALDGPAMAKPVLYRVGRWPTHPTVVSACGAGVRVNRGGTPLPEARTEAKVNGSTTSAWFYDAEQQRLIIKLVQQ